MMETIGVVAHEERHDEPRATSPSWFIAKLNPVSRFIGAILLCVPMFLSLDVVSASAALLIDRTGAGTGRQPYRSRILGQRQA